MNGHDYNFNTLVKENNIDYEKRWKPFSISYIEEQFNCGMLKNMPKYLRKNIAYNFQYLEYIHYQLDSLVLNAAIKVSLYKNFVIVASSIIEAIFYELLKANDLVTKETKELIFTSKANEVIYNGNKILVETNVYKKIEPKEVEMKYDAMIKKIESKHLLNINHNAYPYIKGFRQLRNRIHLQVIDSRGDTDWWAFSVYDYDLMRHLLLNILIDPNIKGDKDNTNILYFLKLSEKERKDLAKYLKNKSSS